MAITVLSTILNHNIFFQRDARDPLGVWVTREGVTGDATGGSIKVGVNIPVGRDSGRIYTCYSVNIAKLTGIDAASAGKVRLLTNFPDADPSVGVQGYASARRVTINAGTGLTPPITMIDAADIGVTPQERFLLLFGPVLTEDEEPGGVNIVELEINENENLATYTFEAWGYYWDRQVLYVPGGPRHPGEGQ